MRSFKLRASIVARIWISEDGGDAGGGGGTTPEWLPDGATFHADFNAENYYANGAEATVADLFEANGDWDAWHPEWIVPGTGLTVTGTEYSNHGPVLKAAIAAAYLTGATIVADFTLVADDASKFEFDYVDLPDYNTSITFGATYGVGTNGDAGITDNIDSAEADSTVLEGAHKAAFTFDHPHIAASFDGGAVAEFESGITPAFTHIGFLIRSPGTILRSITIYPPQPDADLPALSALS